MPRGKEDKKRKLEAQLRVRRAIKKGANNIVPWIDKKAPPEPKDKK